MQAALRVLKITPEDQAKIIKDHFHWQAKATIRFLLAEDTANVDAIVKILAEVYGDICYVCQEPGHIKKECPHRAPDNQSRCVEAVRGEGHEQTRT